MLGRVKHIHFVGIGGAGMSGIAKILRNLGYEVSGSDRKPSELLRQMARRGIRISYRHAARNCRGADVLVYSSAIDPRNPELRWGARAGVPVIPRAEMLAELMRIKFSIAIAGSHGKTTTSSLVAAVLTEAGLDPTIVIGGRVRSTAHDSRLGRGEYLVAEADESDRSFLLLLPSIAVITNIEEEHLDCYGGLEEIEHAFAAFANRVPFYGTVIACLDDPNVRAILPRLRRRVVTYGTLPAADVRATGIELAPLASRATIHAGGHRLGVVALRLAGRHNLLNALAAIAVGRELDISFPRLRRALAGFAGVHRRQEIVGRRRGIVVIDDYGHHPTEIRVTLESLRHAFPGARLIVVFQPHRYTRTYYLHQRFGPAFAPADLVFLAPIYAASEKPMPGVSSRLIARAITSQTAARVALVPSLRRAVHAVTTIAAPGDVIVTLGAGDIWKTSREILNRL